MIDIGRVLSGEEHVDADEKSEILSRAASKLDVTESQLEACKGNNIRITVRQIMRLKFPQPSLGFKFADVNPDYVTAARGKKNILSFHKYRCFFLLRICSSSPSI